MDEYYQMYGEKIDEKSSFYKKYEERWKFYHMAYDGDDDFIETVLARHERESYSNWLLRKDEGYNFNYCSAIVDLFNFYLFEKPATRYFTDSAGLGEKLKKTKGAERKIVRKIIKGIDRFAKDDDQWLMFLRDADYRRTNFDNFIIEAQKKSSIFGSVGILINKPASKVLSKEEEISNKIYPYCSVFSPLDIYECVYDTNPVTGKEELVKLKVKESSSPDTFLVWTKNKWERWVVGNNATVLKNRGPMPEQLHGIIPFTWLLNLPSLGVWYKGESDIKTISKINASIIRDLSYGEEMLKFCGFPMLLEPMDDTTLGFDDEGSEERVGPRAIKQFNPEHGASAKHEWLEPKIGDSIEAVLNWIDRKADEIYRVAHLSGVHGQRKSNNEVASGLALRYEFQQLNSVLIKKSNNLCETEQDIICHWMRWQGYHDMVDNVEVKRPKSFSVDELSMELINLFDSIEKIPSDKFKELGYQKAAAIVLPDAHDTDTEEISKEIAISVKEQAIESKEFKETQKAANLQKVQDNDNKDEGNKKDEPVE